MEHILSTVILETGNSLLYSENVGKRFILDWVKYNNLTVVSEPLMYKFRGQTNDPDAEGGYTGLVLLAESHASIHTYPETNTIFIDLFSCRELSETDNKTFLDDYLNPIKSVMNLQKRQA